MFAGAVAVSALLLGGCGTGGADPTDTTGGSAGEPQRLGARAPSGSEPIPLVVTNCGVDVTFDGPPDRVLLLGRPGIFTILDSLGVSDRVVARAGAFPDAYFDATGRAAIDGIRSLSESRGGGGHLEISQEVLIDLEPDLILGLLPDGIERARFDDVDIPVIEQPADCPTGVSRVDFDDISREIGLYGEIFDRRDEANQAIRALRGRLEDAGVRADVSRGRTAAVLVPTVGGGSTYAYGTVSMAHRQLEAAGFTNVFDDTEQGVFEVTTEELIARNPDVLVLLHVDSDPGAVEQSVRDLPGAAGITAVRNGDLLVDHYHFWDHPTPLIADGLEHLVEAFGPAS